MSALLTERDHVTIADTYLGGASMEDVARETGFAYKTVHRSLTRVTRTRLPAIPCRYCRAPFRPGKHSQRYCTLAHQRAAAAIQLRYGLTPERMHEMLARQHHRCPLDACGRRIGPGSLEVDHCHSTGRVRGLLCSRCNRGLGTFSDNPGAASCGSQLPGKELTHG